ncbi:DUF2971 domain-containing protein [Mesorhizobium sp. ES1-1]|uniref:DUF2971 domain-containing protein n=1 Tax=Mesorhizobium sp. ES1-1 TaxID=2876629 RepID=UPI001CC901D9|nr:DUF2971 domain-containing protein [Mesorhizobium sp. ES1-1]
MEPTQEQLRKFMIFNPLAFEKYNAMKLSGRRFVHYSSSEAAFHMIKTNRIRLRSSSVMNDFMEIEHGLNCLVQSWRGEAGEHLRSLIDDMFPGTSEELAKLFDAWSPLFREDTYIACLSEHEDKDDVLGRLSMWRAYGGPSGVAVVVNPQVFLSVSEALSAFTSPVAYLSAEEFDTEFRRVTGNIEMTRDFLMEGGKEEFFAYLFQAFRSAVLCTKHPGFAEEKEWRIIYAPKYSTSELIEQSVELIRGTPQIVYSIPFKDYPDKDFVGAELPKLINRIIIGPTQFPQELRAATIALLDGANVPDAANKVVISSIPLRQ